MRKGVLNKGMRPVGARALKSAIDSLRPWLAGSTVLDLFSGQGRFGTAALEEEAELVVFVEKDAKQAGEIKKTIARYGTRAEVRNQDAFSFLAAGSAKFDVIFADPPFASWDEPFTGKLAAAVAQVARNGSIFLVKHPTRVVASRTFPGFTHWKSSEFGESQLLYFIYGQEKPSHSPPPEGDLSGDV